jgi:sulfur-oxidizing protein SoxA
VKRAAGCIVFLAATAALAQSPADPRRSGFADMGPALQAIQRDDTANPAMLWVAEGESLWRTKAGAARRACIDCHGDAASLEGAAVRYPAFDAKIGRPVDLDGRIEYCRTEYQQAPANAPESTARLALAAYVARQSRGLAIAPPGDDKTAALARDGEALFYRRLGQLDLSCAQCHADNAGGKLGGSTIPQAHPTGYPLYRSEWQSVGSLQRRMRSCLAGVRAEPYAYGSGEFLALEAFLMRRAQGMLWEAPAVRP